jgi:hypothetical protein
MTLGNMRAQGVLYHRCMMLWEKTGARMVTFLLILAAIFALFSGHYIVGAICLIVAYVWFGCRVWFEPRPVYHRPTNARGGGEQLIRQRRIELARLLSGDAGADMQAELEAAEAELERRRIEGDF